jgi:hypothetical protein
VKEEAPYDQANHRKEMHVYGRLHEAALFAVRLPDQITAGPITENNRGTRTGALFLFRRAVTAMTLPVRA